MSLLEAYKQHQTITHKPKGAVMDWYENLPQEDQNLILEKIVEDKRGWKREMYYLALNTGLKASETRFRDLLAWLERNL